MSGVYKRKSDRARGARGKWTAWWVSEDGRRRTRVGYTDKAKTLELARKLEMDAGMVRDGLLDADAGRAADYARTSMIVHVAAYLEHLVARGNTPKHCTHASRVVLVLLSRAGIHTVTELAQGPIQHELARIAETRSARTANFARQAFKAFVRWLHEAGRIAEVPRWLGGLKSYNEGADRKRVRRVLTGGELEELYRVTQDAPPVLSYGPTKSRHQVRWTSGPDRAWLYRVMAATGFRDGEMRSLVPEDFDLVGCTVRCRAGYTKNRREAVQPIPERLALWLTHWLGQRPRGKPVWVLPWRTSKFLKQDLERAGIPYRTDEGVVDAHAIRHTYISNLVAQGVDIKTVQVLARHASAGLTVGRYSHADERRKRDAVEGGSAGRE